MDTAEARAREEGRSSEAVYDGFLSYAHAADDLLAPRFQAGLQRFAKPWWKRRALRIFRDEASLSANPHLWSSITEALDQSDWFVLLLSPDAAESPWVNREVEYWLDHKDASRILPVVTDGEFGWTGSDISPDTDSAPTALQGAYSDEPRWVDLRWARSDTDLDLRNTQFRAAVADIASALRGVAKDELESEEVKQHRRTIRTAWGAGIALLLLVLVATGAAVYAIGKGNEAEAEARMSLSRELAASAISQLDRDSELSLLLALEAAEVTRAVDGRVLREAEEALHAALLRMRIELAMPESGRGEFTADGQFLVAADPISFENAVASQSMSAFSQRSFAGDVDGHITLWDVQGGEKVGDWLADSRGVVDVAVSPDGVVLASTGEDGVKLWEIATRRELHAFSLLGPITPVFSPDGTLLAATSVLGRVNVWKVDTRARVVSIPHPGTSGRSATLAIDFTSDGSSLAVGVFDAVHVYDTGTWQLTDTLTGHADEVCAIASDPTADRIATGSADGTAILWDVGSGEQLQALTGHSAPVCALDFSRDGIRLASGSQDGITRIWDVEAGELELELTAGGGVEHVVFNGDGSRLVTAHTDGTSRMWDISLQGGGEVLALTGPSPAFGVSFDGAARIATRGVVGGGAVRVWDLSDGSEVLAIPSPEGPGRIAFNADGSLLAAPGPDNSAIIWDAHTGEQQLALTDPRGRGALSFDFSHNGKWVVLGDASGAVPVADLETGEAAAVAQHRSDFSVFTVAFSPDDQGFLSASSDGAAQLSELESGRRLRAYAHGVPVFAAAFSPDGQTVATGSQDGTAVIWDRETAEPLMTIAVGVPVTDVAFTVDGSRLATGARDGSVSLWDTVTGTLLLSLRPHTAGVTDIDFSRDGSYLATSGRDGAVHVLLLDVDALIKLAESRVTRSLTESECERYLHMPTCPDGT